MDVAASQSRPPERLPLLDGLRGIAALCVLGFHLQEVFAFHGPFGRCYLFVDLFFLLSGFVLGLVAEPRLLAGKSWSAFMASRWRRLWPMIAVGAAIGAIAFSSGHDPWTTLLFLALAVTMIPILLSSYEPYPLNGPQWSLLMELMVNLLHGVLLVRLSQRRLILLTAAFGSALLVVIVRDSGNFWLLAELRVAFSYSLGLVFARWRRQGGLRPSARVDWRLPILLAAGAVLALPYLPMTKTFGDVLMIFGIFPLAFLGAVVARPPTACERGLLALGRLSYPLYAVHFPLVLLVHRTGNTAWHAGLAAIAALALSGALAALMERPQRRARSDAAKDAPAIA
jgi:peptidoglycan/LPS O-acetylase OafA/YrhL